MSETCGLPHPGDDSMTCDKPAHPFGAHMHRASATVWQGIAPPVRKGGKSRLADLVAGCKPETRTGPPRTGEQRKADGIAQVVSHTEQEYKAAFARQYRLLVGSGEPFTSEDVTAVVGMPPGHRNAVGALFSGLVGPDQRLGRVVYLAHVKAERVNQNATRIGQYRGVQG